MYWSFYIFFTNTAPSLVSARKVHHLDNPQLSSTHPSQRHTHSKTHENKPQFTMDHQNNANLAQNQHQQQAGAANQPAAALAIQPPPPPQAAPGNAFLAAAIALAARDAEIDKLRAENAALRVGVSSASATP
jgi:hypothetical protein